jgi:hypothetical protein
MLTKDNVTIGIEWRFGPDWPRQRCGAKTRRGTACQCPANKKNGRCRLHGGASTGAKTEEGRARISAANLSPMRAMITIFSVPLLAAWGLSRPLPKGAQPRNGSAGSGISRAKRQQRSMSRHLKLGDKSGRNAQQARSLFHVRSGAVRAS